MLLAEVVVVALAGEVEAFEGVGAIDSFLSSAFAVILVLCSSCEAELLAESFPADSGFSDAAAFGNCADILRSNAVNLSEPAVKLSEVVLAGAEVMGEVEARGENEAGATAAAAVAVGTSVATDGEATVELAVVALDVAAVTLAGAATTVTAVDLESAAVADATEAVADSLVVLEAVDVDADVGVDAGVDVVAGAEPEANGLVTTELVPLLALPSAPGAPSVGNLIPCCANKYKFRLAIILPWSEAF